MNKSDRRLLEAMDDRELADIGLSRSDLPRLCAECAFGSYFYDSFVCYMPPANDSKLDCTPYYVREQMLGEFKVSPAASPRGGRGNRVRSGRWGHRGLRTAIVKAGSAVSATLITWAIVYGLASGLAFDVAPHHALLGEACRQVHPSGIGSCPMQSLDQFFFAPRNRLFS
jgi:Domain of unknown function (DUF1127)